MNPYTIIDKAISNYRNGSNRNQDIFILAYIKACCTDFKTGVSHVTQEKLVQLTKIPLRTIQSIISRLRTTDLITIVTTQNGQIRNNTYHFNLKPDNFYFVNSGLFYTVLKDKEIGLLLLIKSLCINNTNSTLYNRTKISKELGQDRGTVSKLIDELIEKNMILELKNGFQLPANYFPIYAKDKRSIQYYENFDSRDKFVLDSILDICNEKNTILFTPNLSPLKTIFAKFPFENDDVKEIKDSEFLKSNYLPEILKNKCVSLPPKIESLNYFLKVFNLEYIEKEKDESIIILY